MKSVSLSRKAALAFALALAWALTSPVSAMAAEELEGDLEVIAVDGPDESEPFHYFLKTAQSRMRLKFSGRKPRDLTGSRVRVRGTRSGSQMNVATPATAYGGTGTDYQMVQAAPLSNTFGAQNTLVVLVRLAGQSTNPFTAASVQNTVFNGASSVNAFMQENSFGETRISGTVTGWHEISVSNDNCDYNAIASQSEAKAQAAGVNLSSYPRRVFVFPYTSACQWAGLGTVGGYPSRSWINASGSNLSALVVNHELGHNFGLYHASSLACTGQTIGSDCKTVEYGDTLDTMGFVRGHFNAYEKERLGWLNKSGMPPIVSVSSTGTHTIAPYAKNDMATKAIKILRASNSVTGQKTWMYVEFRQAIGFDSHITTSSYVSPTNVLTGVIIHLDSEDGNDKRSLLLDMTPETGGSIADANAGMRDPALTVGRTFTDADTGISIKTNSAASTGASVTVTFPNTAGCVRANPTLTVTPSSQWAKAGTEFSYAVSVKNNDTSSCTATRINVTTSETPETWNVRFTHSLQPILNPGQTFNTTLKVSSPSDAADVNQQIEVRATNFLYATYRATRTITHQVVSSLSLTSTTDKSEYIRGNTATLKATVKAGGAPVAGATVSFKITRPSGSIVTKTATTNSSGVAQTTYRVLDSDPYGTYTLHVSTSQNSVSGSATKTFKVRKKTWWETFKSWFGG